MRQLLIRPVQQTDYTAWKPLWDGYNAFYGRKDETALPLTITETTWQRFFDLNEPVFALVAEGQGQLLGLAHYLFHRSTTSIEATCYLQDLYTVPTERGLGIGRALIDAIYGQAASAGAKEVYWQTHTSNIAGRLLYDQVAQYSGFIVYDHEL